MPIYEAATIDEAVQLGLADLGLAKDNQIIWLFSI